MIHCKKNHLLRCATTRSVSQRAFTLIEVVLALGIMGLMLASGWGSIRNIAESRRLLAEKQDMVLIGESIVSRLVKEFQLTTKGLPLMPPSTDQTKRYGPQESFQATNNDNGAQSTVTFLALEGGQYLPDGGGHSGVVQISYRIVPTPPSEDRPKDSLSLIRSELPYIRPFDKAYEKEMVFPVTHDLIAASFEFYDENQTQWVKEWSPTANLGLPVMIRFSFTVRGKNGRSSNYSTSVAVTR